MKVIFVHTNICLPGREDRVRAKSTVVFSDGDSFSIPIVETEDGVLTARTNNVIIDRDMRKLAAAAALADYWQHITEAEA